MKNKFSIALSLALIMAMLVTSLVLADNVVNDVTVNGTDTFTLGGSTTVSYKIVGTGGDGQPGCNASDGSAATVTINTPAGVTATPGSLTFTSCNGFQGVVFTATAAGDYPITVSVSDSGTGSYHTTPAAFMLYVLAPPAPSDTTPPAASPTQDPAASVNGWNNTDVTITWNWSDEVGGSGIDTDNCTTSTVATDEGEYDVTATCYDNAGNEGTASYAVKIDKTAPMASASASPNPNTNGWNNTNVTVSFTGNDGAGSGIDFCDAAVVLSSEGAGQSASGTCTDKAGNVSAMATASGINIDRTNPVITGSASPTANANGWNNTDVVVSFSCSDALSGVDKNTAAGSTLSIEGTGLSVTNTGVCTDKAGNTADLVTVGGINIDKTAPVFDSCPTSDPFYLNSGLQSVGPISVNADISGLNAGVSILSGSVDTSSIGSKTINVTAVDNADNSASKSCSYNVIYNFAGFSQPVDNIPAVNVAKAGQAIPLKWRLTDANGNPVLNLASVKVTVAGLACASGITTDLLEEYAAGESGLQNLGDGYYQFNWKTPTTYASSCKTMKLDLGEGTGMEHIALFQFKK